MMKRIIPYSLLGLMVFLGPEAFAYTVEECIRCHQKESGESTRRISLDAYKASVHALASVTCQDCHVQVVDEGHKTATGSGRVDCGQCHEQQNRHGLRAEKGVRPPCYACHSRHAILAKNNPDSWVHPENLDETCGTCHPAQTGNAGFFSWLGSVQVRSHGKQDLGREYDPGDCLGCHQGQAAHGEKSLLNDRKCHECHRPLHGQSPLLGSFHPLEKDNRRLSLWVVKTVYGIAVFLVAFGGIWFYIRRFSGKQNGGE